MKQIIKNYIYVNVYVHFNNLYSNLYIILFQNIIILIYTNFFYIHF